MQIEKSVQAQFGAAAAAYASSRVHAGGRDLEAMLNAVPLTGGERVLDAGCGAGHTALAFAPRVREVHALDLTQAMLKQTGRLARERGIGNLHLRRGDVEALPYPAGGFDLVTSRLCAHHFARPVRAVTEMVRVLRPGGALLLSDSVAPEDPDRDRFLNRIEKLRDPSHVRDHSLREWRAWLEAAGLETRLVGSFPVWIEFDDWVARMRTPPAAAAEIKTLLDSASPDLRRAFQLDRGGHYDFRMPIAVLHGCLRPT